MLTDHQKKRATQCNSNSLNCKKKSTAISLARFVAINKTQKLLFRLLLRGRNYILNWVYFLLTILTDRYIHRRELWKVSFKSRPAKIMELKRFFLNFVFQRKLSKTNFCEYWDRLHCVNFIHIFWMFCINLDILVLLIWFSKTKKYSWLFWFNFSG